MSERRKSYLEPLLPTPSFKEAVSKLIDRAERQMDTQKLVDSYVDSGILINLNNTKNQLIFGRRGTGKTHVLKFLHQQLSLNEKNVVVYLDTRILGSSSQFSDNSIPLKQRCGFLFKDILLEIYKALQSYLINLNSNEARTALQELQRLDQIITEPIKRYDEESLSTKKVSKSSEVDSAQVNLSAADGFSVGYKGEEDNSTEDERTISYRVHQDDKLLFTDLNESLRRIFESTRTTLYVLIDEWSSLPLDIQPCLAEFLKKSFFPNPLTCIKIGAIEYRSNFTIHDTAGHIIGFERGGDISVGLDIDDHYVFNLDEEYVINTFAEILYRHIRNELIREEAFEEPDPERPARRIKRTNKIDYLKEALNVESADALVSSLFEGKDAFIELVRACEGVVRDFMYIFSETFLYAINRGLKRLDKQAVFDASVVWFEREKKSNVDEKLLSVLQAITRKLIDDQETRLLLVPQALEKHPIIQSLYDLRIIHRTLKGYMHPSYPNDIFVAFSLDYGCYAELLYIYKLSSFRHAVHEIKVLGGKHLLTVPRRYMETIRGFIFDQNFLNDLKL